MKIKKQDASFLLQIGAVAFLIASSCISKETVQNILPPQALKAALDFFNSLLVFLALYPASVLLF
jgi:hypothetical protein